MVALALVISSTNSSHNQRSRVRAWKAFSWRMGAIDGGSVRAMKKNGIRLTV